LPPSSGSNRREERRKYNRQGEKEKHAEREEIEEKNRGDINNGKIN
jgi:hypothetical protein